MNTALFSRRGTSTENEPQEVSKRMWMQFLTAAAILGFAAVYAVPWVAGLIKGFVPDQFKSYLPSDATPAIGTQAIVSVVVYGALLAVVLILFRKAGVRQSAA